jgi:hypothetical protein
MSHKKPVPKPKKNPAPAKKEQHHASAKTKHNSAKQHRDRASDARTRSTPVADKPIRVDISKVVIGQYADYAERAQVEELNQEEEMASTPTPPPGLTPNELLAWSGAQVTPRAENRPRRGLCSGTLP